MTKARFVRWTNQGMVLMVLCVFVFFALDSEWMQTR